ncbi:phytoene desaturase family protein [Leucobacter luti]|uniref:Pyridine nucleotide-disulfide oxidoreductase domain-containing protein 2 n=1 Tax=Leucobacter luti TaxID=340320 RepID=A0A4Q7TYB3_9MICO|nr:NAD(P)/FAD-dependent oxidoreductase [Leucobacter luti]MBL3698768.1 NAD(P)/FAD-dependent oxidoreductase [Leucobacter luti]RZT66145.1 phytoene dehydrogenase-like protein [Leucobacter luti]
MTTVVIGSGINGMVAAAELARSGVQTVLIERADQIGGFIAAEDELTVPGFTHDTYSSWHPLFVSGAAYAELGDELAARGLAYSNSESAVTASTATVAGERRTSIAYRDPERTAAGFAAASDRDAYLGMLAEFGTRAPTIFGALGAELGSTRVLGGLGWRAVRALKVAGVEELARDALTSARSYLRRKFTGWEVDALWTPWGLHSGLGPDHATGGMMIPVFAAAMHQFGLPIVTGGVGSFLAAFEQLLRDAGVEIRTGEEAEEIIVSGGKVTGVRTSSGTIAADTVLASVSPGALYGTLLRDVPGVAAQRESAASYRPGRAAMQLHLALDRPVQWEDPALREVPLVHLSDGSGSTGIACAQAEAGLLPSLPTVVVGQQSVVDPSRAPEGKATLWLQLQEVPFAPVGDAAERLDVRGGWDDAGLREGYVQRVLDRLEEFAPGTTASVLGTHLIAPTDLLAANPNAIAGDPYAGSAELDQNLRWRPFPGGAEHRTPVAGVWHIGAATHPGPGLGAGSGHIVAQRLITGRTR